MSVSLLEAAAGALLLVAAPYAHEGTHIAASLPWVRGGQIDLSRMSVEMDIPADTRQAIRAWISLSPFFVGLAGLGLLYAGGQVPVLSRETFLLYCSWGWFTTPSLMDLREAAGVDHVETQDEPTRKSWYCALICVWGLILLNSTAVIAQFVGVHPIHVLRLSVGLCMGSAITAVRVGAEYGAGSRGEVQTAVGPEQLNE